MNDLENKVKQHVIEVGDEAYIMFCKEYHSQANASEIIGLTQCLLLAELIELIKSK